MSEVKFAIFLDGPLAGETMESLDCPPTWLVALPKRETWCGCNKAYDAEPFEYPAETKEYYVVSRGERHALYSEHNDDQRAIIDALKDWRQSDFELPMWTMNCRSRRAFK